MSSSRSRTSRLATRRATWRRRRESSAASPRAAPSRAPGRSRRRRGRAPPSSRCSPTRESAISRRSSSKGSPKAPTRSLRLLFPEQERGGVGYPARTALTAALEAVEALSEARSRGVSVLVVDLTLGARRKLPQVPLQEVKSDDVAVSNRDGQRLAGTHDVHRPGRLIARREGRAGGGSSFDLDSAGIRIELDRKIAGQTLGQSSLRKNQLDLRRPAGGSREARGERPGALGPGLRARIPGQKTRRGREERRPRCPRLLVRREGKDGIHTGGQRESRAARPRDLENGIRFFGRDRHRRPP